MPIILNIDTATENASICVMKDGEMAAYAHHQQQKEHASFVHKSIIDILHTSGISLTDIDAFAVTSGPGSYTGLRVGVSTAKGFCYALSKPLIFINTLEVMAAAAIEKMEPEKSELLFCPMIDARRMEVFSAIYDYELNEVLSPKALLLDENSFSAFNNYNKEIIFFGSGSSKYKTLKKNDTVRLEQINYSAINVGKLAEIAFKKNNFVDLGYSEPEYFKEFYTVN